MSDHQIDLGHSAGDHPVLGRGHQLSAGATPPMHHIDGQVVHPPAMPIVADHHGSGQ